MAFTSLTFTNSIPQCGQAIATWTATSTLVYPARLEIFYQSSPTAAWNTTGTVVDVYSSPYTWQSNQPAGHIVWATLVGNDASYAQASASTIVPSDDDSCLASEDFVTITETLTSTQVQAVPGPTRSITVTQIKTLEPIESDEAAYPDDTWSIGPTAATPIPPSPEPETTGFAQAASSITSRASSFQSATIALAVLLAAAVAGIFFLLALMRRRKKRADAPRRPRMARFVDGSFTSNSGRASTISLDNSAQADYAERGEGDVPDLVLPAALPDETRHTPMRSLSKFNSSLLGPVRQKSIGGAPLQHRSSTADRPVSELWLSSNSPNSEASHLHPYHYHQQNEIGSQSRSTIGTINETVRPEGGQKLFVSNKSSHSLISL